MMIKNTSDVKEYFFKFLESNGNRFLREEENPWESGSLYIFKDRLLLTKEQMQGLKQYLFQIRSNQETDSCFFTSANQEKERVIWEGASNYQTYISMKRKNLEDGKQQNLIEKKIENEIEELKTQIKFGSISTFFQSKFKRLNQKWKPYPSEVIILPESIPPYKGIHSKDRITYFLNLLKAHGVEILDSREQPDGVTTIYLDRPVKIPSFLQNFLDLKSEQYLQPSQYGSSELIDFKVTSIDYIMIFASDENLYHRKKLGYV